MILLRFKSIDDKRFNISMEIIFKGNIKWVSAIAHNAFNNSEHVAVIVTVDFLRCAQASIKIESERIDRFLFEMALKNIKNKINIGIIEDQKVELTYDDLVNIDNKIENISSPEEERIVRVGIQKDILACTYKHLSTGATSKELVNYVWCDSDLLIEELWHLDKKGFISYPHFDKNIIDKGGDDNKTRTVLLTPEGKNEYENILKEFVVDKSLEREHPYNIGREKIKYKEKIKDDHQYKCLVIMPIGKKGTLAYKNNMAVFNDIIKPCVENSGHNIACYHSDLISESGGVSKQVIEALLNDTIIIADLRRNNPNVTYELGIRHAFRKRSILICSSQSEHIFYTTTYRAVEYKIDGTSNQDFYDKLSDYINDIIQNPTKPDNPVTDIISNMYELPYNNTSKKDKKRLYVHRIEKRPYSLGSVYNISNEDLMDVDIKLNCLGKNGIKYEGIAKVINDFDDPMRATPYLPRLIKKKEAKHIVNFPRTAVKVTVKGKEADSGEEFEESTELPSLE